MNTESYIEFVITTKHRIIIKTADINGTTVTEARARALKRVRESHTLSPAGITVEMCDIHNRLPLVHIDENNVHRIE
jgi:hypothetical protein